MRDGRELVTIGAWWRAGTDNKLVLCACTITVIGFLFLKRKYAAVC